MCVPPTDDERGDVALLRLDVPQPRTAGAMLRRVALTWDRPVHTMGYPSGQGLEIGVWTRMTLAGKAGVEWLQMNRRSAQDQRVRAGFSGSGVADDATGDVLGIVVSEYTDDSAGLSWMLPVDAIVAHLPVVSEWVVGDSGIDPIFAARGRGELIGQAAEVAQWLRRRHDGAAVLIVLGPDLDAVRQAVAVSSSRSAPGEPVGGIDLALDVEGRTVDEVSRRIVDRAGLAVSGAESARDRLRAGAPPMTIVVDGLDAADEPEALLDEVLKPLVDSGTRLVLGFRDEDAASLAAAKSLADDTVSTRLEAIARRAEALAGGPDGDEWRLNLRLLRKVAAVDSALVAGRLADVERRLVRAERRARKARSRSGAVADDRGLLAAWFVMAAEAGLDEDPGLDQVYRWADSLLSADPVDHAAAHAAVRAYQQAVREALAKGERR
ncbi:putative glycine-rich protein [Alloactinosynnema sp. L-07]|uniref:trypsin-like peptidase domain-containing protein n=1 Tax=Alloactinosynnema sp. L-07 TaxID=1653480 RepID=UPI00065F0B56|nr:trypsin-like peptidase domain-containing protein [Alloactinosynnema sp. L-07]CRK55122.1 putative glycine-rich protein [Alloactinosynnema sp. L-07]